MIKRGLFLWLMLYALGLSGGVKTATAQANGVQWDEPIILFDSGTSARSFSPLVIEDTQGGIKVLWEVSVVEENSTNLTNGIYCMAWDGFNWSDPIDVIVAPEGGRTFWPQHTVDKWGILHLVWVGSNAQLYYGRALSDDACSARSWQTGRVADAGQITNAAVAVDANGVIHVTYAARGANLFYLYSEDNGSSWSLPAAVSPPSPGVATAMPEIDIDATGRIHIVWEEVSLPDGTPSLGLFYAVSGDNGQSWSAPTLLADGGHTQPNVAALDDGMVHLFWNGRAAVRGRYHQWSADGGQSWSVPTEFVAKNMGGGQTGTPRFAVDSANSIHLVTGTDDTTYVAWENGQWSGTRDIAQYAIFGNLEHQNITVAQGHILHVVAKANSQYVVYNRGRTNAPIAETIFEPLPTPDAVMVTPEPISPEPLPPVSEQLPEPIRLSDEPPANANSVWSIIWAIIAASSLSLGVMVYQLSRRKR